MWWVNKILDLSMTECDACHNLCHKIYENIPRDVLSKYMHETTIQTGITCKKVPL